MPNHFVTRNVARGRFWEAIHYVCPEAFEDLASLADDYMAYVEDVMATDQSKREIIEEDYDDPDSARIVDWGYENLGTIFRWQQRWNLAGNKERRWVANIAITNLAAWGYEPDLRRQRGLFVVVLPATCPVFQLPDLEIEQQEDWTEFRQRAEQVFKKTLAEYREAVKDVGAFQQNIQRDARWLIASQVKGLSWKEIADSEDLNPELPEPYGYDSIRKAASNFAKLIRYNMRK